MKYFKRAASLLILGIICLVASLGVSVDYSLITGNHTYNLWEILLGVTLGNLVLLGLFLLLLLLCAELWARDKDREKERNKH